jgi:hypothetical protein
MPDAPKYETLIIRAWREDDTATSERHWRFRVEDVRTAQAYSMTNLGALLRYLRQSFLMRDDRQEE